MAINATTGKWLDNLKREAAVDDPPPDTTTADGKLIRRVVPKKLEDVEHYEPLVVSIGPIHHGKPHLQAMEKLKHSAAVECVRAFEHRLTSNSDNIDQVLLGARNYYSHSDHSAYSDSDWCQMMFTDACFVIEFQASSWWRVQASRNRDRELMRRDLLLFENQLPFEVLQVFPRFIDPDSAVAFDYYMAVFFEYLRFSVFPTDTFGYTAEEVIPVRQLLPHEHFLQRLRDLWINPSTGPVSKLDDDDDDDTVLNLIYDCPALPVTELKKLGIRCSRGEDRNRRNCFSLSEIHFKLNLLSGELILPYLFIHEWTKTLLINLLAHEFSSPDNPLVISSYLRFMGTLINREEDVKELRTRGVVRSSIGDDQAVVEFFRAITAHVVKHDPRVLKHVQRNISAYLTSKRQPLRVVVAEFRQRYFSGPWSFLVFLAVIFTLAMTIIQTVFTGMQTYK